MLCAFAITVVTAKMWCTADNLARQLARSYGVAHGCGTRVIALNGLLSRDQGGNVFIRVTTRKWKTRKNRKIILTSIIEFCPGELYTDLHAFVTPVDKDNMSLQLIIWWAKNTFQMPVKTNTHLPELDSSSKMRYFAFKEVKA